MDARPVESPMRIQVTSGVLLLLLGLLATIGFGLCARPVDGAAAARECFGPDAPPFGLEFVEATRLPTQDVLVRFARPTGAPGPLREPIEATFLAYQSPAALAAALRIATDEMGQPTNRLKEWERDPSFEWRSTRKKDELAWGAWRTTFLIERTFKQGGGWQDTARVDLSQSGKARGLFVRWAPEIPADEAQLKTLLAAVPLAPPPPPTSSGG